RGGLVEADHMTGGFPADDPAGGPHLLEHVPVADLGPDEFDACIEQGMLEPEIAHYRAHYRTLEAAFFLAGARQDEEQLVAIDDIADLVDHHDAIAVAIERDTHMCLDCGHGLLQQRRIRRAATGVDIRAVWRTAYRDYLGTEFTQRTGPDLVTRSIGAVENNLDALERVVLRERRGTKFLVANACRVDTLRAPQLVRLERYRRLPQELLDLGLLGVGQLRARAIEELDAVVLVQVVRCADNHAEVGLEDLREVRDAGGRQWTEEQYVRSRRDETCFERGFKHVAGEASVFADQDGAALRGEHLRGSARQPQRKIRTHRVDPHRAAHAVRAEILLDHSFLPKTHDRCGHFQRVECCCHIVGPHYMRASFHCQHRGCNSGCETPFHGPAG